jgi:uncharacterized protein
MKNYVAKDVGAYIAGAGKEARPKLREVRAAVKSAVPGAREGISWGVPFYKYHGLLAGFAAFKRHVAFGLVTVLSDKERKALADKGYVSGKKTIQIRFDQKTPTVAIKRILRGKAKANAAKRARPSSIKIRV